MGITQDKNIIIYKGTKYQYTFDLMTRKADGDIERVLNYQPKNVLELLVRFYLTHPDADGFYETLIKNVYSEYNNVGYHLDWYALNEKIADIKKNYHQMKKWATENQIKLYTPHSILRALESYTLTPMEYDFYYHTGVTNKEILTKYAYQFQKYRDYLNIHKLQTKINVIIGVDGKIEKPSNICDFLLKIDQRYKEVKTPYLNQQMQKYYEKYKKYNFTDGKYEYIVPSTVQEVMNEAQMQNNCLYNLYSSKMTSDNYRNVIICVRDINNPTKSLYTIEYTPYGKCFNQCYAKDNVSVNEEIANYLLNQVMGRE